MHCRQRLHTVRTESTYSAGEPALFTMAEQPALMHLALSASLLPTMSVSATAADALGVATSSLPVERASIITSVTLLALHQFWSVLHSSVNGLYICVRESSNLVAMS